MIAPTNLRRGAISVILACTSALVAGPASGTTAPPRHVAVDTTELPHPGTTTSGAKPAPELSWRDRQLQRRYRRYSARRRARPEAESAAANSFDVIGGVLLGGGALSVLIAGPFAGTWFGPAFLIAGGVLALLGLLTLTAGRSATASQPKRNSPNPKK